MGEADFGTLGEKGALVATGLSGVRVVLGLGAAFTSTGASGVLVVVEARTVVLAAGVGVKS